MNKRFKDSLENAHKWKKHQWNPHEPRTSVAKMYVNAFKDYPDFYSFVRSLQAYQQSFDSKQDVMILNPNTDFFKFMKAPNKQ